jgi:osmotically-inducible protein OsmY
MKNNSRTKSSKTATISLLLCATLTLPLLSGCLLGAAAAVATGAYSASDRRSVGTQTDDGLIQLKVKNGVSDRFDEKVHLNVAVYNRQVLLTGEVPNETTRSDIEKIAANVAGVRLITNDLQVRANSSTAMQSTDTFITGKVKASLLDAQDISASAIKVVTEAKVVYLMGIVSEREANRAAQIASGVTDVAKVVKVMDIVSEEELSNLSKTPRNLR